MGTDALSAFICKLAGGSRTVTIGTDFIEANSRTSSTCGGMKQEGDTRDQCHLLRGRPRPPSVRSQHPLPHLWPVLVSVIIPSSENFLTYYLSHSSKRNLCEGMALFCSLFYPRYLDPCLVHSRCSNKDTHHWGGNYHMLNISLACFVLLIFTIPACQVGIFLNLFLKILFI